MIKKLLMIQKSDRTNIKALHAEIKERDKAVEKVEAKSQDAFTIISSLEKQLATKETTIQEL